MNKITYMAAPTCEKFHRSDAFVRGLMGPIGSGKSVACCWELFKWGHQQKPSPDGVRRTRFAVIRNTYRELLDTTLKTWHDWFPKQLGKWSPSDMAHTIMIDDVEMEVLFRALDKPEDIKKLLSLELTAAWVNEAREIPRAVIDMLTGRIGRYPSMRDGGPTRLGIIMDTNPPDVDHWWYKVFEEQRPEGWELFKQPSGISAEAENIRNLPPGYYKNMTPGKTKEWINIYVHGQYGFVKDGKPIWAEYVDDKHCADNVIEVVKNLPLVVGIDFGLTPAAAICQEVAGQFRAIDELVTEDMGALQFGRLLAEKIRHEYSGHDVEFWGDPSGENRAQTDKTTPFQVLLAEGVAAIPTYTNDFTIRREAVASMMTRMTMTGEPAFLVSPKCKMLRKGLGGGYRYRRVQVSGDEKYMDKPDKNMYSHICEALQYAAVGAGKGTNILGMDKSWSNADPADHYDRSVI